MASFEERSVLDPIKIFRPKAHDAKAWWRYAILAERYKVRCAQREDLWRKAGISNINILAHIRSLIKKHGSVDGVNLQDVHGNYLEGSTEKLHSLEMVVDDLNRENMVLRKMIKTLLTPLARESYVGEELSLEDIDKEISVFEEFTAKSGIGSPVQPRSHQNSPLKLGGQMEDDVEDELIADLASCVDSPSINLHSPYENLLPPITVKHKEPKSNRNTRVSIRDNSQKPAQEKLFPSYVEREAMRRETLAKKRQESILKKADELLRCSIAEGPQSPSSYLPSLPARPSERSTERNNVVSVERSAPSSSGATDQADDSGAEGQGLSRRPGTEVGTEPGLDDLEQPSLISVSDSVTTDVHNGAARVGGGGVYASKRAALAAKLKAPKESGWCDDFRVEDKTVGRGKGKPREPSEPPKRNKDSHKHEKSNTDKSIKPLGGQSHDPRSDSEDKKSSPRGVNAFPQPHSEMTEAEKLSAKAISKARGKHRSAEEAKKPLTNLEKMIMKSPLALPVMKAPPGAVPMISPREKALRSKVSPRVQSFIYPQRPSPRPQPAVEATSEVTGSGEGGDSAGVNESEEVVDTTMTEDQVTVSDLTHTGEKAGSVQSEVVEEIYIPEALNTQPSVQDSIQEEFAAQNDDAAVLDPPLPYPDSPLLDLHSGDNSTTSPPSPKRKTSPRVQPSYAKPLSPRTSPRSVALSTDLANKVPKSNSAAHNVSAGAPSAKNTQRSPQRSPRQETNTSNIHAKHKNIVAKHHLQETLTSHSAPGTVMTSKAKGPTSPLMATSAANTNLNLHIDEDVVTSSPRSVPSSPGRRTEDEKLKKKNALKSLNGRSNPGSPRDESPLALSPRVDWDVDKIKLSEELLTAAEHSSVTVGEASPSKDF